MLESLRKLRSVQEAVLFVSGTYGNYPFEELLEKANILKIVDLFGQKIPTINACLQFIAFKPHIVILFGIESITGIVLYAISRMLRAKTVVIVEENYVSRLKDANLLLSSLQMFKKILVKSIYNHANILVAESKASMRYVIEILNIKRKRYKPIYVRPHGILLQPFLTSHTLEPGVAKKMMVRKIALPQNVLNKVWVSFMGEPSYNKGADLLLDAIMLLKKTYHKNNYVFLFPGLPLLRDKRELKTEYVKKLFELVREGTVVIYPKFPHKLVPIFYQASDIIVLPSRLLYDSSSDRSPNVAIEALASGKIIIASHVGGIPDIVGDAGVYVKPNDPRSLAMKIIEVLENIQNFTCFRVLATNRARKYFDVRTYALTLLKSILTDRIF